MKLKTLLMEIQNKEIIDEFVKFVVKELGIKKLPSKITVSNNSEFPRNHLTFGVYAGDADTIVVYYGNRHLADTLRTLAHELVHHKQREDNKPLDGHAGSDVENEANAIAGVIMRKFREAYPDLYAHN